MPDTHARLTRQEMYGLMWSHPMKEIVTQYDEKMYTLAFLCEKHRIPRPPNRYWPQRRLGKIKQQPPLPVCDDLDLQMVPLRIRQPVPPSPAFDDDIAALLERAKQLPPMSLAEDLGNLHPLIELTRKRLEASEPDMYGLLRIKASNDRRILDVLVSRPGIKRAMLLLDTVVKALEPLGGQLKPGSASKDSFPHIFIAGEACSISLSEHYTTAGPHKQNRDPHNWWDWSSRKWDYKGSGMMDFGSYAKDTEWRRLEDRLNAIVISIIRHAGWKRIDRRLAPEREKQRKEEERIRQEALRVQREQEYLRMQQRMELQRKQEIEREHIKDLLAEAQAWQQSIMLRRYIRAAKRHYIQKHGALAPDSDFAQKLAWAEQQADRIDPLTLSPPSILDSPPAETWACARGPEAGAAAGLSQQ